MDKSARTVQRSESGRERILLDEGWRFALGHATDPSLDFGHATGYFSYLAKAGFGDGPANPSFEDHGWRLLDLPHDWAVEAPFDERASKSHGFKAVGPKFPERSVGWYRRKFSIPEGDLGKSIRVEFDGIFRAARVFVNGFFLGEEPSGYASVGYDLTDYLNYGGDNVLSVRVDASMEEGWFYEGAGIYRHVRLLKTAPLHVGEYGTFVRSQVEGDEARISVETTVTNEGEAGEPFILEQEILGSDGKTVARSEREVVSPKPGQAQTFSDILTVKQPGLWSLENPTLHTLATVLRRSGQVLDRYETPFGIRTIRFDPNQGLFLNGRRVEIKGTNNHQDHAGVGVALPDALQVFRLKRLKDMGSNTYRCSHHPPTPELLDACDRMGMLVIDENRLMGVNDYHLRYLEKLIRRDRNHPSVILWSIGNEEWGIEGNIKGARIAKTMQNVVHRLDPTRLVTVAISGGWGGSSSVVDAAGVNYIKQGKTDDQHAKYPWQVILGTEESTTQGTRGVYLDDKEHAHLAPCENGVAGGNAELGWKHYAARPFLAGLCYWTGFDYRGEPDPVGYPGVYSQFGILDTCGFPKDTFFYIKSQWTDEPMLHLAPHWNWAGREGEIFEVRAYSNCGEVELFLNGKSLGRKVMEKHGHLSWRVPYAPGKLSACGYKTGKCVVEAVRETTGPSAAVELGADRLSLKSDGKDLSVVRVGLLDKQGRWVPTACDKVLFSISGPGRILGVGNGDPGCHEPDCRVEATETIRTSDWVPPVPAKAKGRYIFETTFDLPAVERGEFVSILLGALGPKPKVMLNNHDIPSDFAEHKSETEFWIDPAKLQKSRNVLRLEAQPALSQIDSETLGRFRPAFLRMVKPPLPWARSAFNGLAQVIVQSTGAPGEIVLEAKGEGLKPARLILKAGE
jgi:beta-galactosidase